MLKKIFYIVILIACVGSLISCAEEKTTNTANKEYEIEINNFAFGMAAGENNQ